MNTTTTETIPLSRHIFTGIETEGIEFGIVLPERDFTARPGRFSYAIRLHKDGSVCDIACGCGLTESTVVDGGATVTVDEWTWCGGRLALAGWRRIGPSEAETELRERAEVLAEALDAERGNHKTTNADLVACIRRLEQLQATLDAKSGRLEAVRASVRNARADRVRADEAARRSAVAALVGWTAAVVLAVAFVLAVIA